MPNTETNNQVSTKSAAIRKRQARQALRGLRIIDTTKPAVSGNLEPLVKTY